MTARRSYRLGKRAAAVDQTKKRILEAALAEFTERGIDHTSLLAVARRADVAAGTVLYHFPTIERLAAAVVSGLQARIEMPGLEAILRGEEAAVRVRRLIDLMYRLYDRTSRLYPFFVKNEDHPLVRSRMAGFEHAVAALIRRAVDGRSARRTSVIAALVDVSFYANLTRGGLTLDDAIDAAAALAESVVDRSSPPKAP